MSISTFLYVASVGVSWLIAYVAVMTWRGLDHSFKEERRMRAELSVEMTHLKCEWDMVCSYLANPTGPPPPIAPLKDIAPQRRLTKHEEFAKLVKLNRQQPPGVVVDINGWPVTSPRSLNGRYKYFLKLPRDQE